MVRMTTPPLGKRDDDYSDLPPDWDQTGGKVTHEPNPGLCLAPYLHATRPDGTPVVFIQGEQLPRWVTNPGEPAI